MNIFAFETKEELLSDKGLCVLTDSWKKYAQKVNSLGGLNKFEEFTRKHNVAPVFAYNKKRQSKGKNWTMYPTLTQRMVSGPIQ